MQSGLAKSNIWQIAFPTDNTKYIYPTIGWTGSADMKQELNRYLQFPSKEEAIRFAEKKKWQYEISEPQVKKVIPKSYTENFK